MDKCRLCLKNSKKLRSVFDKEHGVFYIDMITSISNIKINRDDKITNICTVCCRKLKEAFDFKNMMEMCNLIFNEDAHVKRINFNNLEEIKIKVEIDVQKNIDQNCSENVLGNLLKNSDQICLENTIIKKIEPNISPPTEDKITNVYDYVKSFKDEPDDENIEQDLEDYDFGQNNSSDDEYVPPKKGKENEGIKRKKEGAKTKKGNNTISSKVLIKPVFLDDIAIVRTKVERKKIKRAINEKCPKKMCNVCGKMTTSLKTHILVHSERKKHKCDTCEKTFYTPAGLIHHKKKHVEAKKYKCDQCVATFSDRGGLKGHLAVHSDEKNYVCEICKKSFKRRQTLRRHFLMHNSANKNIKCDQCNMTFFTNSSLKHHIRVHTGERPYRCEMCSQGYSYKHDFNRHCFKKHGVFLKRRKVYVMNEEVLEKERVLMRALMLKLHGLVQGEDPFKEFEGPQGYKALEQAINLLETKQLPVDV